MDPLPCLTPPEYLSAQLEQICFSIMLPLVFYDYLFIWGLLWQMVQMKCSWVQKQMQKIDFHRYIEGQGDIDMWKVKLFLFIAPKGGHFGYRLFVLWTGLIWSKLKFSYFLFTFRFFYSELWISPKYCGKQAIAAEIYLLKSLKSWNKSASYICTKDLCFWNLKCDD